MYLDRAIAEEFALNIIQNVDFLKKRANLEDTRLLAALDACGNAGRSAYQLIISGYNSVPKDTTIIRTHDKTT